MQSSVQKMWPLWQKVTSSAKGATIVTRGRQKPELPQTWALCKHLSWWDTGTGICLAVLPLWWLFPASGNHLEEECLGLLLREYLHVSLCGNLQQMPITDIEDEFLWSYLFKENCRELNGVGSEHVTPEEIKSFWTLESQELWLFTYYKTRSFLWERLDSPGALDQLRLHWRCLPSHSFLLSIKGIGVKTKVPHRDW